MAKKRVHRVPHERVKAVLADRGIVSVNQAIQWGQMQGNRQHMCERCVGLKELLVRKIGADAAVEQFPDHCHWGAPECRDRRYPLISAKSVEGIVRGKRVLGVEFERVDQILCALEAASAWYDELAEWYYPPGPKGELPEAEFGTFALNQNAAFERACEMLQGLDAALLFR